MSDKLSETPLSRWVIGMAEATVVAGKAILTTADLYRIGNGLNNLERSNAALRKAALDTLAAFDWAFGAMGPELDRAHEKLEQALAELRQAAGGT